MKKIALLLVVSMLFSMGAGILPAAAAATLSVTSTPANNANDVDLSSNIVLNFSNQLNSSTVTKNNIVVTKSGGEAVSYSMNFNGSNQCTFTVDGGLEFATTYEVNIAADVADMSGNNLPEALRKITFHTVTEGEVFRDSFDGNTIDTAIWSDTHSGSVAFSVYNQKLQVIKTDPSTIQEAKIKMNDLTFNDFTIQSKVSLKLHGSSSSLRFYVASTGIGTDALMLKKTGFSVSTTAETSVKTYSAVTGLSGVLGDGSLDPNKTFDVKFVITGKKVDAYIKEESQDVFYSLGSFSSLRTTNNRFISIGAYHMNVIVDDIKVLSDPILSVNINPAYDPNHIKVRKGIGLDFGVELDMTTVNKNNILLKDAGNANVDYNLMPVSYKKCILNFATPLRYASNYQVQFTSDLKDRFGKTVPSTKVINFTTQAVPPDLEIAAPVFARVADNQEENITQQGLKSGKVRTRLGLTNNTDLSIPVTLVVTLCSGQANDYYIEDIVMRRIDVADYESEITADITVPDHSGRFLKYYVIDNFGHLLPLTVPGTFQ